jgi:ubiquinone/menaquinone biosynthesis C-methylase UbiE
MHIVADQTDMLNLSCRRYWFKPVAAFFNSLQLRAYQAADVQLASPVLDVGCSDGGFGVLLSDAFGRPDHLVGIELLKSVLDAAGLEARSLYREMLHGSATSLPFPDDSFQTVTANASLFAVHPGLDEAIAEFHRVLRPGGTFYASVCTDRYDQHYWLTRFLRRAGSDCLARRYANSMNARMMQAHMLSPKEWQAHLVQGGFVIRQCHGFLSLADTSFWSFLAWAPLRVNGVLRYISSPTWRNRVAACYENLFRKRFEASRELLPAEDSGYIFIEAKKL